jgi:hypothetical protein
MPLDASIYQQNGNSGFQMPDMVGSMQKAQQMSQLAMQNRQMRQEQMENEAVKSAFRNNVGEDGTVNRTAVLSDLSRTSPLKAMAYQQQFAEMDAKTAEAKKKSLQDQIDQHGMVANLAGNATDQASYDRALQWASQAGLDTSKLPKQYDPGLVRQIAVASMDQAKRLQSIKELSEVDINNKKAPLERAHLMAQIGKENADADKTRSETVKRNPELLGQTNDPEKLVPSYVPKEHQKAVFDEIKSAQDVNALAPKILAAFEMGSSRNPIVAAQGQREFEGLINTTVKDAEGTTRQAAFDSIHKTMTPSGLLASPGENEARRRTVLEYLQSKAAAPTAKAYGIDLAQYNSTKPYESEPKKKQASGGLIPAAVADERVNSTPKAPAKPSPKVMQKAKSAGMEADAFIKATAKANGIDEATAAVLLEAH